MMIKLYRSLRQSLCKHQFVFEKSFTEDKITFYSYYITWFYKRYKCEKCGKIEDKCLGGEHHEGYYKKYNLGFWKINNNKNNKGVKNV